MADASQPTPRAEPCWRCDFASGYRGMDRCAKCDGTGSLLMVRSPGPASLPAALRSITTFPNTVAGMAAAQEAARAR